MESVVGGRESVKKTGAKCGLNFLSGVPLEQFVAVHSLTWEILELRARESSRWPRKRLCEKFHN